MIIRPAMLDDLAQLVPCISRRAFAHVTFQFTHSAAVTVERDGVVLATGGLFPQPDHYELWFMAQRGLKGSRQSYGVIRMMYDALHAVADGLPIHCYVQRGNVIGLRLCRMFGFAVVNAEDDGPWIHLCFVQGPPPLALPDC
jgi:hypothetical protein